MIQSPDDTIAAIASAVGAGARMIVRLSGPQAHHIASQLTCESPESFAPVRRNRLRVGHLECDAWTYAFLAPRSYTGQDIVEFHLPGNPLLVRMLLDELIRLGARHAGRGEFTARAYFNGRLDLSQAEGVAAIIAAGSESELRAARQLLAGELARRVKPAMEALAETLALVEVGIDFSEEDIEFLSADQIRGRLDDASSMLENLVRDSARLERLHHAPEFVLVGRPNAGKSTLLNALAGEQRAVVSPHAGTTRDALSAEVILPRGMIRLIDVAGIDEAVVSPASGPCEPSASAADFPCALSARAGGSSPDQIARRMNERARSMLESADRVILVRDAMDDDSDIPMSRAPDLTVQTKSDLLRAFTSSPGTPGEGRGEGHGFTSNKDPDPDPDPLPGSRERGPEAILISVHTGQNMETLRRCLDVLAFGASAGDTLALNARHLRAIADARQSLEQARQRVADGAAELLAVELREALDSLGAILGQVTPDDVLGRIFSSFCIGK